MLEDLKDFLGEVGIIDINGFERVFFFSMHESANGGEVMVQDDSSVVTIYYDETEIWKEYDSHEEFYSTVIANDQITSVVVYKSETWQEYSAIEDVRLECYGYGYTPYNGENMGFGADTYEHLYELVKNYFDEQIQAGNMTQEDADRNLAEMTKESTHIFLDADGNFIK